jgi:hypothetical protein
MYARKPNPERGLVIEKELPSMGPQNYQTCPFAAASAAKSRCPRMAGMLQKTRQPTKNALAVNEEATKLIATTKDQLKQK